MRRNCPLALVPLLASALPHAAAQTRPAIPDQLSLKQALSIAFSSSTALRTAEARLQQAEARTEQSRAPLLPQLNLGAFQGYQTVNLRALGINVPFLPGRIPAFPTVDARAFLTQDLFNMASRQRNSVSKVRLGIATAQQENTRELLVLSVVSAYVQALRGQNSLAALNEQSQVAERLAAIVRDRAAQGISSRLEVNRAEQQVNNLKQQLAQARGALAGAKLQLANLLHATPRSDYSLEAVPAMEPPAASDLVAAALQARADYRAAQASVSASQAQIRASRATRLPTLQFRADFGASGQEPTNSIGTWRIQGAVNMPLFTSGRIRAEIAEAEAALREAQAVADEIKAQVETDVLTALASVEAASGEVQAATGTVGLAREELDLATARFTGGVADNTEVVNAQDRLARAQDNLIRAEFDRNLAALQLRRATGAAEKSYRE